LDEKHKKLLLCEFLAGKQTIESKTVVSNRLPKRKFFDCLGQAVSNGSIKTTKHARYKMEELGIDMSDLLYVFKQRKSSKFEFEWHPEYDCWHYTITANDLDGHSISVVVTLIDFSLNNASESNYISAVVITCYMAKITRKRVI